MAPGAGTVDGTAGPSLSLGQLLDETPGFRRVAYCMECQARVELPVLRLIETHGAAAPAQIALAGLTCPCCASSRINVTMARLS